jgi:membrane protease YdiL (CAAX protease family)
VTGRGAAVATTALATVLAWLAAAPLPPPARLWTVALLVVLPAFSIAQARAIDDPASLPRVPVYASTILSLWLLALASLGAAALARWSRPDLGLVAVATGPLAGWTMGTIAAGLALVCVAKALGVRESALLERLIPRTPAEKAWYVALSVTAGATEEIVFRGFLLFALLEATGSTALAVLLANGAFGVVHAYQQPAGAARAAALGAILTAPVLATGSLLPAMTAHAMLDLITGLVLRDRLLQ